MNTLAITRDHPNYGPITVYAPNDRYAAVTIRINHHPIYQRARRAKANRFLAELKEFA